MDEKYAALLAEHIGVLERQKQLYAANTRLQDDLDDARREYLAVRRYFMLDEEEKELFRLMLRAWQKGNIYSEPLGKGISTRQKIENLLERIDHE